MAGPFVCRCLASTALFPFPHSAHRTGVRICRIRLSEKTHAIAVAIACDAVRNFGENAGVVRLTANLPFPLSLLASTFN